MKKILIFNKKKKEKKENNISFLEFLLLIIESRNAKTKFKYFNPTFKFLLFKYPRLEFYFRFFAKPIYTNSALCSFHLRQSKNCLR